MREISNYIIANFISIMYVFVFFLVIGGERRRAKDESQESRVPPYAYVYDLLVYSRYPFWLGTTS